MSHILPHLLNGLSLGLLFALDCAGLHAHRERDGGDQPRPRIALRARCVLRAGDHRPGLCLARLVRGGIPGASPAAPLRAGLPRGTGACRRRRHGSRALHAPDLRQEGGVRPAAHLRRGARHRGDDPGPLGPLRAVPAGAAGHFWGLPLRRADLLQVQALRGAVRGHRHRLRLALPGAHGPMAPSSRPAPTTARWCGRSGST